MGGHASSPAGQPGWAHELHAASKRAAQRRQLAALQSVGPRLRHALLRRSERLEGACRIGRHGREQAPQQSRTPPGQGLTTTHKIPPPKQRRVYAEKGGGSHLKLGNHLAQPALQSFHPPLVPPPQRAQRPAQRAVQGVGRRRQQEQRRDARAVLRRGERASRLAQDLGAVRGRGAALGAGSALQALLCESCAPASRGVNCPP